MSTALWLENVSKEIKKRKLVRNVSLKVNEGEIYGFLGPNGAGKTTTIRMIVGLIKPTAGKIEVCGYDIQEERSEAMSKIGAIVENPETYSYLTGRQNLIQYARLARLSARDREKSIEEVIQIVGLKERINDKVKTYSLGMRQRLGLAQALLSNPKLLVLDEPTNGLDPSGMKEFRELLMAIAQRGIAVFISSHLLNELELICDRVAIIQNGELITEKRMSEMTEANPEVMIEVDQVNAAMDILIGVNDIKARPIDHFIALTGNREKVAETIKALALADIKVYSVMPQKQSLEGSFLEITSQWKQGGDLS